MGFRVRISYLGFWAEGLQGRLVCTWTPQVCRMMAFYVGIGPVIYLLLRFIGRGVELEAPIRLRSFRLQGA